jgi:hypothetical protein
MKVVHSLIMKKFAAKGVEKFGKYVRPTQFGADVMKCAISRICSE